MASLFPIGSGVRPGPGPVVLPGDSVIQPTAHRSVSWGSPPAGGEPAEHGGQLRAVARAASAAGSARSPPAGDPSHRPPTPGPRRSASSSRCRRSAGLSRRSSSPAATSRSQARVALDGCTPMSSASAARCSGPRLAMITRARTWVRVTVSSTAASDLAATPINTRDAASTASTSAANDRLTVRWVAIRRVFRNPCSAARVASKPVRERVLPTGQHRPVEGGQGGATGGGCSAGPTAGMGGAAGFRVSRGRDQRVVGGVGEGEGRPAVRAGPARGDGRVRGGRVREVQRRGGGVRGDQRARRDSSVERAVRREARSRAGGGDRGAGGAVGDGRLVSAGGGPAVAVQGRLQRLRADVHGARSSCRT